MVSCSPCSAPGLVLSCDTPLASHTEQKAILWPDPALLEAMMTKLANQISINLQTPFFLAAAAVNIIKQNGE